MLVPELAYKVQKLKLDQNDIYASTSFWLVINMTYYSRSQAFLVVLMLVTARATRLLSHASCQELPWHTHQALSACPLPPHFFPWVYSHRRGYGVDVNGRTPWTLGVASGGATARVEEHGKENVFDVRMRAVPPSLTVTPLHLFYGEI